MPPITESKSLTIKISNPDYLTDLVEKLAVLQEEMGSLNVRNTPIRDVTLQRWRSAIQDVHDFLTKFLPKQELNEPE